MCCFFTALVFFGPRLGFLVYWLLAPLPRERSLRNVQPALVGGPGQPDLYPWTALMYVMIFPIERL